MQHCKKLVLMPHESVVRLQEKTTDRTTGDVMTDLDQDMNIIMRRKAEDHEKWAAYDQVLQRYLHFAREQRKPVALLTADSAAIASTADSTVNKADANAAVRSQILAVVPQKVRDQAGQLFDMISSDRAAPFISWDSQGVVSLEGRVFAGTNIIDLVADASRTRKLSQATSWKDFADVLRKINVPLSIIGNANYKNYIQKGSGHHGGPDQHSDTPFSTPSAGPHNPTSTPSTPFASPASFRAGSRHSTPKRKRKTTTSPSRPKHRRLPKTWEEW